MKTRNYSESVRIFCIILIMSTKEVQNDRVNVNQLLNDFSPTLAHNKKCSPCRIYHLPTNAQLRSTQNPAQIRSKLKGPPYLTTSKPYHFPMASTNCQRAANILCCLGLYIWMQLLKPILFMLFNIDRNFYHRSDSAKSYETLRHPRIALYSTR